MSEKPLTKTTVSLKNTKEQILAAYHEALERLQRKQQTPEEEKSKSDKAALLNTVAQLSPDAIVAHLAQLKVSLARQLDGLSANLVVEFTKLTDVQQALKAEQQHLEDLYGIQETAQTLSALIMTQQEEEERFKATMEQTREVFDQDMAEKRTALEKQLLLLQETYKEQKEKLAKERQREEEDYAYTLELTRRQEKDAYTTKKEALEKELEERKHALDITEADIKARVQEYDNVKAKVAELPQMIEQARQIAIQETTEKLTLQHTHAHTLNEKEREGEQRLAEQKIAALEAKIKEQEALIRQTTDKADQALKQMQALAARALDVSSQRLMPAAFEKPAPQPS